MPFITHPERISHPSSVKRIPGLEFRVSSFAHDLLLPSRAITFVLQETLQQHFLFARLSPLVVAVALAGAAVACVRGMECTFEHHLITTSTTGRARHPHTHTHTSDPLITTALSSVLHSLLTSLCQLVNLFLLSPLLLSDESADIKRHSAFQTDTQPASR